ncbi:MAG: hypothetical protein JWM14_1473 [Chitinophagaceae bacterium]|nr:hypothetical protein [Chitinophagaceae bacterium]
MRLLTLLLLVLITCSLQKKKEYFEGELIFNQTYTSEKLNVDSLMATSPNGAYYLINQRYYKGLAYTDDSAQFVLDGAAGRNFTKTKNDKGFTCEDVTMLNMDAPLIHRNDKIEVVNGFRCKSFEATVYGRKSVYYYSLDYQFNPMIYSNYQKWNWKQLMEASEGGITIKSIHYSNDYNLIIEIKSLKSFKIDDKAFKLNNKDILSGC